MLFHVHGGVVQPIERLDHTCVRCVTHIQFIIFQIKDAIL